MRKFNHIAKLVRETREKTDLTQKSLCYMLGYKNGQFISNIERGLCSIPVKDIDTFSKWLAVSPKEIKDAMVNDYRESLDV